MKVCVLTTALLLVAGASSAQSVPFSLVPEDQPRVEVAAHLGWEGVAKLELENASERYDSGSAAASFGYFWTPHLKTELGVARAGRGEIYQTRLIEMRGLLPVYRSFQHTYEGVVLSPTMTYQFLRNQWVHPFVSAGAHIVREQHRVLDYDTRVSSEEMTISGVPFVGGGAKFFISERAFIRTDVRTTVAEADTRRISWTAGVGVDF